MDEEKNRMTESAKVASAEIWQIVARLVATEQNPVPALLALAQCAGNVIADDSGDVGHVEEGVRIFADLTRDQARGRYLNRRSAEADEG